MKKIVTQLDGALPQYPLVELGFYPVFTDG